MSASSSVNGGDTVRGVTAVQFTGRNYEIAWPLRITPRGGVIDGGQCNTDGMANSRDTPMRVALTNDFELVVAGLARLLEPFAQQVKVVDEPVRGAKVAEPVDLALFDTFGHPGSGLDEINRLRADANVARIAVFTWQFEHGVVVRAINAGVVGYLSKNLNAKALVDAMLRIGAGEVVISDDPITDRHGTAGRDWPGKRYELSERESEVLVLIAEGLSNAEIATTLYLSPNSVKTHIRNAYRKLEVTTRAQAVRAVLERHMTRRPVLTP